MYENIKLDEVRAIRNYWRILNTYPSNSREAILAKRNLEWFTSQIAYRQNSDDENLKINNSVGRNAHS